MLAPHNRWLPWLGVALCALTLAPLAHADVPVSPNANRRFKEGVRYLKTKDADRYERAYREFKAAYADSPSWKILGNLGIVAQELERDGEAIDAFKGYLEGGRKELNAAERRQFSEDLEVLQAGHATVALTTTPDGAWIVDEHVPDTGSAVVNRYGPTSGPLELRIRAGHHVMRAELSGYSTATWEFDQPAGSSQAHTFTLKDASAVVMAAPVPTSEPRSAEPFVDQRPSESGTNGLRVASYVALGLGAVGIGAGTWFYVDAKKTGERADADYDACAAAQMSTQCADDESSAESRKAIASSDEEGSIRTRSLVSFAAGGALLATGVVLLLVSSPDDEGHDGASISPWIGPQGVGVSGRF
jgi:hypothetical protein